MLTPRKNIDVAALLKTLTQITDVLEKNGELELRAQLEPHLQKLAIVQRAEYAYDQVLANTGTIVEASFTIAEMAHDNAADPTGEIRQSRASAFSYL